MLFPGYLFPLQSTTQVSYLFLSASRAADVTIEAEPYESKA